MSQVIIYPSQDNKLAVIIPTLEALEFYTIEQIAKKDVPSGIPYKIIDSSLLPQERIFREAWEADFSEPDGYGSELNTFN